MERQPLTGTISPAALRRETRPVSMAAAPCIEQNFAARQGGGQDGALRAAYRVLCVHKDEQPAVYAAAHGSDLQAKGH